MEVLSRNIGLAKKKLEFLPKGRSLTKKIYRFSCEGFANG
jgi:hypothetical protein